jgi:drug/metabolite transporter (DMT)-like permease
MILLGERLPRLKLAGLLLGFGGVVVLFNPFGFDWGHPEVVLGNGLLMLAAVGWAAAILHIRGHVWHLSPLQLAPWQMLTALPPLLALALWFEGGVPVRWSDELLAILIYNGPIATAFGFWAAVSINRTLPAITTSLAFLGVPAVGVALSAWSLGEPLTSTLLIGFALILGGLVLVNLADLARR